METGLEEVSRASDIDGASETFCFDGCTACIDALSAADGNGDVVDAFPAGTAVPVIVIEEEIAGDNGGSIFDLSAFFVDFEGLTFGI